MPHRRVDLLAFARRQPSRRMLHVVALLAIAASCRRDAPDATVIVLDTSSGRDSLEVVALPVDPASLHAASAAAASPASILADSTASLDIRFQRERTALNTEARLLAAGDRRSPQYSERFDAWRRRAIAADSLRARRDKLRVRTRKSAAPLPDGQGTLRASLVRATSPDGRAALVRSLAPGDSVSLDLSRGEWWVGIASPGGIPSRWSRASGPRLIVGP